MRILFVHNHYKLEGGEDQVLSYERDLINRHGHITDTFAITNMQINRFVSKLKTAFYLKYSHEYKQVLLHHISGFNPDIIHAHNLFPLLTPSIYDACIESKIPVVQTLHNYRTICSNALLMRDGHICELCISGSHYNAVLYRCYRNSMLGSLAVAKMLSYHRKNKTWKNKVDCFIALTQFAKKKFIQGGFPEKEIMVKPNFFAHDRAFCEITNNREGVLFIGRLSHEKGIKTLLNAWKTLDISLKIAGEGPLVGMIDITTSSKITLLGQIPPSQVTKEMAKAKFLVMPSECYEGFPMVLVEAFAHGLPVIASNLGGMSEIVKNNITGLHFEPGNPEDLAKKVLWMYAHPDECERMGKNARNEYEQKYTPEKNYKMLMDIYQKTIENYEIRNS